MVFGSVEGPELFRDSCCDEGSRRVREAAAKPRWRLVVGGDASGTLHVRVTPRRPADVAGSLGREAVPGLKLTERMAGQERLRKELHRGLSDVLTEAALVLPGRGTRGQPDGLGGSGRARAGEAGVRGSAGGSRVCDTEGDIGGQTVV